MDGEMFEAEKRIGHVTNISFWGNDSEKKISIFQGLSLIF